MGCQKQCKKRNECQNLKLKLHLKIIINENGNNMKNIFMRAAFIYLAVFANGSIMAKEGSDHDLGMESSYALVMAHIEYGVDCIVWSTGWDAPSGMSRQSELNGIKKLSESARKSFKTKTGGASIKEYLMFLRSYRGLGAFLVIEPSNGMVSVINNEGFSQRAISQWHGEMELKDPTKICIVGDKIIDY